MQILRLISTVICKKNLVALPKENVAFKAEGWLFFTEKIMAFPDVVS